MSERSIRIALETRLKALAPALATAYENAAFTPPADDPYQRVHLLPADPENPEMGGMKRFLGLFQVMLVYPQGSGPGDAAVRAEAIRSWFPRGLSLTSGGLTLIIDGTPRIMAGFEDGDRWTVPIRIPYFANVS